MTGDDARGSGLVRVVSKADAGTNDVGAARVFCLRGTSGTGISVCQKYRGVNQSRGHLPPDVSLASFFGCLVWDGGISKRESGSRRCARKSWTLAFSTTRPGFRRLRADTIVNFLPILAHSGGHNQWLSIHRPFGYSANSQSSSQSAKNCPERENNGETVSAARSHSNVLTDDAISLTVPDLLLFLSDSNF